MTSPTETETEVKKEVKATLDALSPLVFQFMPSAGWGKKGIPDHIACVPVEVKPEMVGKTYGMFVAIESKKPDGKLHGLQPLNISSIIKAGGYAQVIKSKAEAQQLKQWLVERFDL